MFHLGRPQLLVLGTVVCFTASACTEKKASVTSSRQEVTVSGTVKIHGKLASEGEISFDPSNYLRAEAPRTAPIGKDGRYTITTLVGENTVRVSSSEVSPLPVTNEEEESGRGQMDRSHGVAYLEVQVELKSGQSALDVELPAPLESGR